MAEPREPTVPGNAKVIAAWCALVVALSGAIEARVKLGTLDARVNRMEQILENRYASAD